MSNNTADHSSNDGDDFHEESMQIFPCEMNEDHQVKVIKRRKIVMTESILNTDLSTEENDVLKNNIQSMKKNQYCYPQQQGRQSQDDDGETVDILLTSQSDLFSKKDEAQSIRNYSSSTSLIKKYSSFDADSAISSNSSSVKDYDTSISSDYSSVKDYEVSSLDDNIKITDSRKSDRRAVSRRDIVYFGPAPGLPLGWKMKKLRRTRGGRRKARTDSIYQSSCGRMFKSRREVYNFLEALNNVTGGEVMKNEPMN